MATRCVVRHFDGLLTCQYLTNDCGRSTHSAVRAGRVVTTLQRHVLSHVSDANASNDPVWLHETGSIYTDDDCDDMDMAKGVLALATAFTLVCVSSDTISTP